MIAILAKVKKIKILGFFIFIGIVGIINYWCLSKDIMPPVYDASVCYSISYGYYNRLVENFSPSNLKVLLHNINSYPPLYMLVVLPFFYINNGPNSDLMAMVNILYFILLIWSVYKIAVLVYGELAGVLSVIIFITFPSVIGFSRITHINIALTSVLSFNIYMLLKTDYFLNKKFSKISGIIAGIGMLFSFKYLLYLIGPLFLTLLTFQSDREKNKMFYWKVKIINFILFLIFFIIISSLYYLPFFIWESRFFKIRLLSPPIRIIHHFAKNAYFFYITEYIKLIKMHILLPNSILLIISIILLNLSLIKEKQSIIFLGWFCTTIFIISLTAFLKNVQIQPRFLLPILPSIAIIVSGLASKFIIFLRMYFPKSKILIVFTPLICVVILTYFVSFFKEHPYPQNSYQLIYNRHSYGMLHIFSGDNPGEELFSYLNRLGNKNCKITILTIFDNNHDPAPLSMEFIYDELKHTDLNIELATSMTLAIISWHERMSSDEKEKFMNNFFKRANYILYIISPETQQTLGRGEYHPYDNERLKKLFELKKKEMELVWEYKDNKNFFIEKLFLYKVKKST